MFTVCHQTPLPAGPGETYRGAAFDGCQYFFTVSCACQIAVTDRDLCPVKMLTTRRPYSAICYDSRRGCFWAAAQDCRGILFQLSPTMQEIDRLDICLNGCPETLTSVSFCCDTGRLLVSLPDKVLQVQPAEGCFRLLCQTGKGRRILSALCLSPYLLLYVLQDGKPYFLVSTGSGKPLKEEPSPLKDCVCAMLACGGPKAETCQLLLLTNKRGYYPHLLHIPLPGPFCQGLCPCPPAKDCCPPPCHPCPPSDCAAILQSISLQEAALAHILNVEGEKLQKVIETSPDPCQLLRVNQSVQKTIQYAIQLEQVLFAKLDALREVCGEPKEPPCPPERDDCFCP